MREREREFHCFSIVNYSAAVDELDRWTNYLDGYYKSFLLTLLFSPSFSEPSLLADIIRSAILFTLKHASVALTLTSYAARDDARKTALESMINRSIDRSSVTLITNNEAIIIAMEIRDF